MDKVRADKLREVKAGHDGTWVAHPDLVAIAREAFEGGLAQSPKRDPRAQTPDIAALLDVRVPNGAVTSGGVRTNVRVAVEYLADWLVGSGAVGIVASCSRPGSEIWSNAMSLSFL